MNLIQICKEGNLDDLIKNLSKSSDVNIQTKNELLNF